MESAFRRGIYSTPSASSTRCSPSPSSSSSMMNYLLSNSIGEGKYRTHHPMMMRSALSPLSPVENLEISPVKVEEDVLVMDGILLSDGGGGRRSAASAANLAQFYGGGYRSELCRSWEDFGTCRNSAKCQFAHGKEELRPTRISTNKTKPEAR
ncbi:Zinc finger, CCCH-type [Dillenia turbinata]|uniref:Zinc finger, CCCH-type n=1 Tax=Dillenia turbinata TaxID=194707 RepID=A0AAN8USV7_9MAGN